jgi:ribosomal protein S21
MQVSVRDNNVDQALRALKKKLQREGVFREMKLKQHFEKRLRVAIFSLTHEALDQRCYHELIPACGVTTFLELELQNCRKFAYNRENITCPASE